MRYIIREKIFSLSDRFTINDENGQPQYEVVGKILSLGNKLNLYDMQGNNLSYVEQKILRFLPEYTIYKGDNIVAIIKKEFTLFIPKFNIQSKYGEFTIEGDVFKYSFNVLKDGKEVAWISKKWISFSDTYTVDIANGEDHAFLLSLVIVLDQIFHDNRNKN